MATYLLAWELGAGTGHCVNLLPIAKGLLARGHRVFAAVRDLPTALRVFGDLPVEYLQAPILQGRPLELVEFTRTYADILHNSGYCDNQTLSALVAGWRSLLGSVKPSVVLCEHAPTALLASRFAGVRRAIIGTGFFSPPDETPLRELLPWMPPSPLGAHPDREPMVLDRINRILTNGSQPTLERVTQLYSDADANFLLTFPELDHFGPRSETDYHGMWSPSGGATPEWPPSSKADCVILQ